jgi:hypothetical protein
MNEVCEIDTLLPDGRTERVTLSPSPAPPWTLTFSGLGIRDREYRDEDLFDALIALRRELDAAGCRLLCAGARRDVFPSGMSREMGGARKAYICRLGSPAHQLVDIFDEALPEQVGTVDEQHGFRQRWIASLKER